MGTRHGGSASLFLCFEHTTSASSDHRQAKAKEERAMRQKSRRETWLRIMEKGGRGEVCCAFLDTQVERGERRRRESGRGDESGKEGDFPFLCGMDAAHRHSLLAPTTSARAERDNQSNSRHKPTKFLEFTGEFLSCRLDFFTPSFTLTIVFPPYSSNLSLPLLEAHHGCPSLLISLLVFSFCCASSPSSFLVLDVDCGTSLQR